MKTCTKCKEEKPFSEFHKNRAKKDGLCVHCKTCKIEVAKSHYEKNKDHFREYKRKYRQENKDLIRERDRKYKQENKDLIREYSRKYRQENKEKIKERVRKYRQENRDRIREYKQAWNKNLPSGVYKITNTINGKIYVGESTGYKHRFWSHKSRLKCGTHRNPGLQTDYDQHSLDIFDFQVIEEHPPDADKNLLLERETYFINKYKEEGKELYNVD
jgi:hypothetical protein